MEEQEIFTMIDEDGKEREAKIINVIEINNQEYVVYAIEKNEEENAIYASKIIKNSLGEEEIVSIANDEEREIVFETIKELIEELD